MATVKLEASGVLRERDGSDNGNIPAPSPAKKLRSMDTEDVNDVWNESYRMEWTHEWLRNTEFATKENIAIDMQYRTLESYPLNCFFEINENQFHYLITKLSPKICNYQPRRKRKTFSAEERMAITLKYLATGEFHSCRNYCFRAAKRVIFKMIANVCLSMYELLKDEFIYKPKTSQRQWKFLSEEIETTDELRNCLGTLLMRQINLIGHRRCNDEAIENIIKQQPLILSAIIDNNNNFTYVNVERTKSKTYDHIFECSTIKKHLEDGEIFLPKITNNNENDDCVVAAAVTVTATITDANINVNADVDDDDDDDEEIKLSSYFIADGALPLKHYLMKTLHYRPASIDPSHTFCTSINSGEFHYCRGIDRMNKNANITLQVLSNIFAILSKPLDIDPDNARKIILGCIALYNFLRKTDDTFYQKSQRIRSDLESSEDATTAATVAAVTESTRQEAAALATVAGDRNALTDFDDTKPNVVRTHCFNSLSIQKGESIEGNIKRKDIVRSLSRIKDPHPCQQQR